MDDAREFWSALEYRVTREFRGFAERDLRYYSCDGLIPDEYDFEAAAPCIRGVAYCGPTGQERWRFVLFVGAGVRSPADIDGKRLVPTDDVTGWLSVHQHDRMLVIDPESAYPD